MEEGQKKSMVGGGSQQCVSSLLWVYSIHISICVCVCVMHVQLFVTPWTGACQAPVHGILQARIMKWVAKPSFRDIWVYVCIYVYTHTHTCASKLLKLEVKICTLDYTFYFHKKSVKVSFITCGSGTSLVVQWVGICLPMQGTQILSLAQEDSTCCEQLSL